MIVSDKEAVSKIKDGGQDGVNDYRIRSGTHMKRGCSILEVPQKCLNFWRHFML
jgi:hypothetical protein